MKFWKQYLPIIAGLVIAIAAIYFSNVTVEFDGETGSFTISECEPNEPLSNHFTAGDFLPVGNDKVYDDKAQRLFSHQINKQLVCALDALQEQLGVPIQINSAIRSKQRQMQLNPSAPNSQHLTGEAVDITINDPITAKLFKRDLNTKGALFNILISNGIGAIGVYDNHFHLGVKKHQEPDLKYWDNTGSRSPNSNACNQENSIFKTDKTH